MTRPMADILADGDAASAALLAADKAGDTAEVARLHAVMNDLTREAFAAYRAELQEEASC